LRVILWAPNTEEEWSALIAAGVDGIITNEPAALIDYPRQRSLR